MTLDLPDNVEGKDCRHQHLIASRTVHSRCSSFNRAYCDSPPVATQSHPLSLTR